MAAGKNYAVAMRSLDHEIISLGVYFSPGKPTVRWTHHLHVPNRLLSDDELYKLAVIGDDRCMVIAIEPDPDVKCIQFTSVDLSTGQEICKRTHYMNFEDWSIYTGQGSEVFIHHLSSAEAYVVDSRTLETEEVCCFHDYYMPSDS